jgi:hypothetical protein
MGDPKCPYHYDHENRLKNLEVKANEKISPVIWVGLLSFLGVLFSTIGSLLGIVLNAYFK